MIYPRIEKNIYIYIYKILTRLHGNLSDGPGGIVTHRNKLWVEVESQDGHELSWGVMNMHHLQYSSTDIL